METFEVTENYGKAVRFKGDIHPYKLCWLYSNMANETLCWIYDAKAEMKFLANRNEIELA